MRGHFIGRWRRTLVVSENLNLVVVVDRVSGTGGRLLLPAWRAGCVRFRSWKCGLRAWRKNRSGIQTVMPPFEERAPGWAMLKQTFTQQVTRRKIHDVVKDFRSKS